MNSIKRVLSLAALASATLILSACERPPVESVQNGFRGTGMAYVYSPRLWRLKQKRMRCLPRFQLPLMDLKQERSIKMSKC